ncbi:NACHT domain-containing protein [Paraburkholderia kirstenboschensis]|uniref:ATP-binding protein n=1 Tax=Paraburkholderia kirstenboschensis TaxID=1245436 RepID=A0ABZ0ELI5_9BURK|nr:hypothetical protein [Paraburkholderia kirstenboschensis]WOD16958.1 hypothetical protein RW095_13930 [Paraburkholderia kirstenboschensis]
MASRQAIASLRGYIYQLHASLASWMRLPADGELHLEVAEDYAELLTSCGEREQSLRAVQVKDTRESGSITLNTADVLKAIETLFSLQESNPGRPIFLTYLTTSSVGKELKNPLASGTPALELWLTAANGGDATELHDALRARFTDGPLAAFLNCCSETELRGRLLKRLNFACGHPSWEELEAEGREYLVEIRNEVRAGVSAARGAYDVLLAVVLRRALQPKSRMLSRQSFVDAFVDATAVAVPSQQFIDLTDELLRSKTVTALPEPLPKPEVIDFAYVTSAARKLGDSSRPPRLLTLFPDASSRVRCALDKLSECERWVVGEATTSSKQPERLKLSDLVQHQELHHIVYAGPGAGKSHALSRLAAGRLGQSNGTSETHASPDGGSERDSDFEVSAKDEIGETIPLLLPIGGVRTADEVLQQLRTLLPAVNLDDVLQSTRVCILLDGWSEFGTGENFSPRASLLRALAGARVVACARHRDASDTSLKSWTLEQLEVAQIRVAVEQSFDGSWPPSEEMVGLLRFPLILSLYLLLGGSMATTGDLIAHFHRHLSQNAPEQFEAALTDAVSLISLSGERSYNKFISALRTAAAERGIVEPLSVLRQLGTITQRGNTTVAVHDLYWSWLAGVGYLRESRVDQAALQLDTRESLMLALESGEFVEKSVVISAAVADASLAATLESYRVRSSMEPILSTKLEAMFEHQCLSIRCRAAIAGICSGRATYIRRALEVINQLASENLYVPDVVAALNSGNIFAHRAVLAQWLGGPGTQTFIEAISTVGDEKWMPWLEQMFHRNLLEPNLALAAALACGTGMPAWCVTHMPYLLLSSPWLLRFACGKGANRQLALWLARNYPQGEDTQIGAWFQVNDVLVSLGDDAVFEELLLRFPSMTRRAQELLGMAVPRFGDHWVAQFQKLAFAEPGANHHHRLAETLSLEVDDATAREWIARGYYLLGWRVLVARRGHEVLPELLAQLPASFGGQPRVLALEAIALLDDAPESLLADLNLRLFNETSQRLGIMPKVGESLIFVAAKVKRLGMAWLIGQILRNPNIFGGYHAKLVLKEYISWKEETGQTLTLDPSMGQVSFECWYARIRFVSSWDEHMSPEALRLVPDVAVEAVLETFANDDEKAEKILSRLDALPDYSDALFERMIASEGLTRYIPKVFGNVMTSFPPNQMLRLAQSDLLQPDVLFHSLKAVNDVAFEQAHFHLLKRAIGTPLNLYSIRAVADMLRGYSREALFSLVQPLLSSDYVAESDILQWLLRETGYSRRELLTDEQGKWLH